MSFKKLHHASQHLLDKVQFFFLYTKLNYINQNTFNFYLLLLFLNLDKIDRISENIGRFDGLLFQHLVIREFKIFGQSLGISGLRPHAAIPTAACTGEYAAQAASPVTISQIIIPKLYTLLIHVSVTFSGSPEMICSQPEQERKNNINHQNLHKMSATITLYYSSLKSFQR